MFTVKDSNNKDKVAGRSRGKVIDNRDPLKRGRIRVDHPALGETGWIPYLRSPGIFTVPAVNDLVYVECDCGFYEYPVAWGLLTKGKDDAIELPEEFKTELVPQNRGMFTPGGHLFEMHDGEAEPTSDPAKNGVSGVKRGIRLTSIKGNKIHISEDFTNQVEHILLEGTDGSLIKIDVQNSEVTLDSRGQMNVIVENLLKFLAGDVTLDADSFSTSTSGNTVISADGTAQFVGTGKTEVGDSGSATDVNGSMVKLAGGSTPLVLATAQFIGTGNLGAPVISTIMSGQTTKVTGN